LSAPEGAAPSQGWFARQSSAARVAIVGGLVVVVGAVSFVIAYSVSSSPSQSPAALAAQESKTTDLYDLGSYCNDNEDSWLIYIIGSDNSVYQTPALLAAAPGRKTSMAAYLGQHRYPAALAGDVDRAAAIFAQSYLHLVATQPKPAPGRVAKLQYLNTLYAAPWDQAVSAISSYCAAHSVPLQRQIVAVPSPTAGSPSSYSYSLP
jgi:hypothetical protein